MADFSGSGAMGGAMSGFSAGASSGNPYAAAAGAVVGLVGGGFFGAQKNKFNMGALNDLITQRQAQINQFATQLESARNNVLSNYQNLQSNTMKRFMPAFEANLAGRGLSASGGAFASGVGQAATTFQGQYDAMNANMTENNLNTIGQLQSNLFGTQFGIAQQNELLNMQERGSRQAGIASLFGQGLTTIGNMGRLYGGAPVQQTNPSSPLPGLGGDGYFNMGSNSAMGAGRGVFPNSGNNGFDFNLRSAGQ